MNLGIYAIKFYLFNRPIIFCEPNKNGVCQMPISKSYLSPSLKGLNGDGAVSEVSDSAQDEPMFHVWCPHHLSAVHIDRVVDFECEFNKTKIFYLFTLVRKWLSKNIRNKIVNK